MTAATPHHEAPDREHDVVVVGARSAGAATAMLLARQGHDVALLDRATFPSDTLSTHALSRGGVVQLARWGLLDQVVASGAPPVRTVTLRIGEGPELTWAVKERAGVDHLLAPRRHVLDTILVHAAESAGATLMTGVSVTDTNTDGSGRVVGVTTRTDEGHSREIRGRFVVGADGVRSRIARSVGAPMIDRRTSDSTAHYAYVAGLDDRGFEFHVAERTWAGIFPTNGGEAAVWICVPADDGTLEGPDRSTAFAGLLARRVPALAERVRAGDVVTNVRSAVRFPNHVRAATGPGWALVGDAGYHRDPITGHGMTDAFRDAELLARQLGEALRGTPEDAALATYEVERYRALAPIFDVTWRLAQYPAVGEFVELQKHLNDLTEAEADVLAALPPLPRPARLVAA
jgi:2-polyprenyl-6-methoxyphenol hydroxylase-like FAD-dependent oxidoreductase